MKDDDVKKAEELFRKSQKGAPQWEGMIMLLCLAILSSTTWNGFHILLKIVAIIGIILVLLYSIHKEIQWRKIRNDKESNR